jgi:hypothetical protein
MAKRLERFESIAVEQDGKGAWGIYRVTRFPMTGTKTRRVVVAGGRLIELERAARQIAAEQGISYKEVD